MKTIKKLAAGLLAGILALSLLAGCGSASSAGNTASANSTEGSSQSAAPLRIVCTIFPIYDWLSQLTAGHEQDVELTCLLDNGVDLHSYQPTADDLVLIAGADLLVCVGGESDRWVSDMLRTAPSVAALRLLDELGSDVQNEELLEGMQPEDHEDADEPDASHADANDAETEPDEHVWLSVKNARLFCALLAEKLAQQDPRNAADYLQNAAAYEEKLAALDEAYRETADTAARRVLLFADRYPFCYLARDYGLTCYAAFPGCSAETEASFETVAFLAQKVDEYALPVVLTLEGSTHKLAQTVAKTAKTSPQILTLSSMQSVTAADSAAGTTYLSVMEQNLTVLRAALN